ncbi:unnamed protein product [Gongylonema pulchrum]|uniref:ABC transmembrane type-1 domain-containing protein n=1 Tax=Gongylonema pulchrum TaxID=637853 RepID=A0A183F085_9BILA|nr:unnamed protein product [Gongylonema pulchrum]
MKSFLGVETDADGVIANARALSAVFRLKDNFRPEILNEFSSQFAKKMAERKEALERTVNVDITWWSHQAFMNAVTAGLRCTHYLLIASASLLITACIAASFGVNGYQVS